MPSPDLDRVRIAKTATQPGDFLSVVREPHTERLWLGHSDAKIYSLDFAAEKPAASVVFEGHASHVSGLTLVGGTLVSASWDRKLKWWDLADRREIRTVDAHDRWIRQLAANGAGTVLATVSDDMTCKLWDATSGKPMRTLKGFAERVPEYDNPNKIFSCAVSPDGRHVAAADDAAQVIVWETESGREAARFEAAAYLGISQGGNLSASRICCMTFSPDGRSLALAGKERAGELFVISGPGLVQIHDWQSGRKTYEQKASGQFESIYWHPQSSWILVVPFANGPLCFLDPEKPRVIKESPATLPTYDLAVNEAADAFYTVGSGKALKWEIPAAGEAAS